MNREFLFRGQTPEGKWVEGFLCRYKIGELFPLCIQVLKEWDTGDYMEYYEVLPETVGQFTGKTDKNGKRVFEGDNYHIQDGMYEQGCWEIDIKGFVAFENGSFGFNYENCWYSLAELPSRGEIIGTVFDKEEK